MSNTLTTTVLYQALLSAGLLSSALLSSPAYAIDCASLATWNAQDAYTGSTQVQYQANAYKANWWNRDSNPASHSAPYQEWSLLGACSGSNAAPVVSLTSPINNALFSKNDSVVISADASDSDGNIAQVIFSVDGQNLGQDTIAPYTLNWSATVGHHQITATATDNQGASSSKSVSVSVSDPTGNAAPSVSLTSPTTSSQLQANETVILSANASDTDGSIAKVEFYVDDISVAIVTNAPFTAQWDAIAGAHSFKAKATDDQGSETVSQSVMVNVSTGQVGGGCAGIPKFAAGTQYALGNEVENMNHKYRCDVAGWCSSSSSWAYEPGVGQYWQNAWSDLGVCAIVPQISITAPTNNSVILAGSNPLFSAQASDSDGAITQVEFFAQGISLGIDNSAPYSITWPALNLGEQQLKAIATDNEGNLAEATASVTVTDAPLVVSLTSPANGSTVTLGQTVTFDAQANALLGDVTQVVFSVNGSVIATDTSAPYSANWLAGSAGNYTVSATATDTAGNTATSAASSVKVIDKPVGKTHKLIGYWHDFVNPAGCPIPLREMSSKWDVIDIAFADNDRNSNGTVHFNLFSGDIRSTCPALDPVQFKQEMAALQAQGKIFVLSLGGAEGNITLNNDSDEANFVSSLTEIIAQWGFDGLDIDLESGSNLLHGTQIQARLPRALKQIETNMGGNMYLTMAPEHPYVQGGMVAYSGIWGAYIPLIDQLRDTLDLLHVQLYNNGGLANPYTPGAAPEGSVDMMVASVRMLTEGFTLANGSQFAPLRDDQVAIGLPSGPKSANSGQAPTQNIINALDCLTKGTSCGAIVPNKLNPNLGGVMTWSINWDAYDGYNFSGPIGDKLAAMNAAKQ